MTQAAVAQWLTFELAEQLYATPLLNVREVAKSVEITEVPGASNDLLGVCHMRGNIVPVMDGRLRLGFGDEYSGDPASIAVVMLNYGSHVAGLRVDSVGNMLVVDADAVSAAPLGSKRADDPVTGVVSDKGRFVALLDVGRLFRVAKD